MVSGEYKYSNNQIQVHFIKINNTKLLKKPNLRQTMKCEVIVDKYNVFHSYQDSEKKSFVHICKQTFYKKIFAQEKYDGIKRILVFLQPMFLFQILCGKSETINDIQN